MKFGNFARITPKWGWIRIAKHKSFEYQIEFDKWHDKPVQCSLTRRTECDHAGVEFIFSVYKLFWLMFSVYDNRHWDYDKNTYVSDDDCGYSEEPWH